MTVTLRSSISLAHLLQTSDSEGDENSTPARKATKRSAIEFTDQNVPKRRTIFKDNRTPSVTDECSNALVKEHAYLRVQLIYVHALAIYKLGLRSDGTRREGAGFCKGPAWGQGYSGSDGLHGAHSHPISGIQDNIHTVMCKEIEKELNITPTKVRYFEGKQIDLQALVENAESIDEIISCLYQSAQDSQVILRDTELGEVLQTTTNLPALYNLRGDAKIERIIRDDLIELFEQTLFGDITPEELTERTVGLIKKTCLNQTMKLLENIMGESSKDSSVNDQLRDYFWYTSEGTKVPKYEMLAGKWDADTKKLELLTSPEKKSLGAKLRESKTKVSRVLF